jgi:hypothetical protein
VTRAVAVRADHVVRLCEERELFGSLKVWFGLGCVGLCLIV